jgi:uncharacterized protein YyaL (SSP411 family)
MAVRSRLDLFRHLAALAILTLAAVPAMADAPADAQANRLAGAASPYLLQHAHNPVDWYPWSEEAIARARNENKLIFISIGYSTCYWCHVAERTIYANPTIAALMNRWFINIKVDREERPDLDQTFMLARQMLVGSGGWPNNLFLTPDLKPFFAGSYFPPEDRDGASGFPTILKAIHDQWQKNPRKLRDAGEQVSAALRRVHDLDARLANKQSVPPEQWLATARDHALSRRDEMSGGLDGGGGTKFPQSPMLHLLLTDYRRNGTPEALATVGAALEAMAHGGIHDHLCGGMHRYSTEPTWSVPHFEKMLYDNAQLLGIYAEYYAITRRPFARDMAADLAGYLTQRMMSPGGGFFTAEDADIDGREGETYLWTRSEIVRELGKADADLLLSVYTLAALPSDPHAGGVLRIRIDQPAIGSAVRNLAPLRSKLLEARNKRRQPARDEKIVVALNGLAIDALARAGRSLGALRWIEAARNTAELLWQRAFDESTGRLRHHIFNGNVFGEGFLDDYALLGLGFLSLADATSERLWTDRARSIATAMTAHFIKDDGCVATARPDPASALTTIDLDDQDMPSGTSAAYALLTRLGQSDPKLAKMATALLDRVSGRINTGPSAWPSLVATAALSAGAAKIGPDTALDSSAHVKLALRADVDRDEIHVMLTIEPGYHINANPASDDYLIPTAVTVSDMPNAKITYPAGQPFKPKFTTDAIAVYEGSASIPVTLPKGRIAGLAGRIVKVEVQACTAQVCLAPVTLTAAVP